MPDSIKDLGKVFVRDIDSQADELAQKGIEIGRKALGELWDKEPEVRDAYIKATKMSARGVMRTLGGETLPSDFNDNVKAQFSLTNVQAAIIANRVARSALANFLGAIVDAVSGFGGPGIAAIGNFAKNWIKEIGK